MTMIIAGLIRTFRWAIVDLSKNPESKFGGMRNKQGPTSRFG